MRAVYVYVQKHTYCTDFCRLMRCGIPPLIQATITCCHILRHALCLEDENMQFSPAQVNQRGFITLLAMDAVFVTGPSTHIYWLSRISPYSQCYVVTSVPTMWHQYTYGTLSWHLLAHFLHKRLSAAFQTPTSPHCLCIITKLFSFFSGLLCKVLMPYLFSENCSHVMTFLYMYTHIEILMLLYDTTL